MPIPRLSILDYRQTISNFRFQIIDSYYSAQNARCCNFFPVQRYTFTMNDVEALYRRHAPAVFRFALSLSGSRAAAEDLTSETFVRLWTARDRVDLSTVVGYLFTITRHLYLQGLARDRRRGPMDGDPIDSQPLPDDVVETRSELGLVLSDLQTLPESDRAALLMRAHDDLPYAEIAAALRISVGSAKVKVHRARQRLAALRIARSIARTPQAQEPIGEPQ